MGAKLKTVVALELYSVEVKAASELKSSQWTVGVVAHFMRSEK